MAITKNKTQLTVIQLDKELRSERRYFSWGNYFYDDDYYDEQYYDYDYYHDYCNMGYSDCDCASCVDGGWTTMDVENVWGEFVGRKCIPSGKEWFRKSQIDSILRDDTISEPFSDMHIRLRNIGLAA